MSIHGGNVSVSFNGKPIAGVTSATVSNSLTATGLESTYSFVAANADFNSTCFAHITDDSMIEYQDGLVIAYCKNCNARITVSRVPGGVNKLKVTNVLAVMRENPEIDPSILESIIDLQLAVEEEIEDLRQSLLLLYAVKDDVCRRLLG